MQYLGLFFEIIFFALGVYLYLFSLGKFTSKDPEVQKKADAFRKKNKGWLKPASLLLIALMGIEIYLNLRDLIG